MPLKMTVLSMFSCWFLVPFPYLLGTGRRANEIVFLSLKKIKEVRVLWSWPLPRGTKNLNENYFSPRYFNKKIPFSLWKWEGSR